MNAQMGEREQKFDIRAMAGKHPVEEVDSAAWWWNEHISSS